MVRPLSNRGYLYDTANLVPTFTFHGQNGDNTNEQDLIRSLHRECIGIHGVRFVYIRREFTKLDRLFGEDTLAQFIENYQIPGWVENFDGYGPGGPDVLNKFGIQVRDELTIRISAVEFQQVTGLDSPREGDAVYVMLNQQMMEVKWVEDEEQFYPLGQQMTFQLRLEAWEHTNERFNTNVTDAGTELDNINLNDLPDTMGEITPDVGDNPIIQNEVDQDIDWTEQNPFGTY